MGPANLLDTVVEFNRVAVRAAELDVPVATGHIPSYPADLDPPLFEEMVGINYLFERADLPGDLIDRNVRGPGIIAHHGAQRLRGKEERMVIRAMAGKDDSWVWEASERWRHARELAKVQFIGDTRP